MPRKAPSLAALLLLTCCFAPQLLAGPQQANAAAAVPAFIEARLAAGIAFRKLQPGETVRGKVLDNVFSGDHLFIPKGSSISLTVSRLVRQRRETSGLLPWPIRYFRSKYVKVPHFDSATVTLAGGATIQVPVVAVSPTHEVRFTERSHAKPAPASAETGKRPASAPGLRVQVVVRPQGAQTSPAALTAQTFAPRRAELSDVQELGAGARVKLALLDSLSTARSHAGESFKALLVEPVRLNADLTLPEGTVFEGRVVKITPARRLHRSGSLHLAFDRLDLPQGLSIPISASLAGIEVNQKSVLKMNPEGGLTGRGPGKKRVLVELGIGAGLSKVADDGYQLLAEALVSTATDASTAGTARLVGFAVTSVYWLTRRGRDVTLPPYTTFTIRFDRSPDLPPSAQVPFESASPILLSPQGK